MYRAVTEPLLSTVSHCRYAETLLPASANSDLFIGQSVAPALVDPTAARLSHQQHGRAPPLDPTLMPVDIVGAEVDVKDEPSSELDEEMPSDMEDEVAAAEYVMPTGAPSIGKITAHQPKKRGKA